MTTTTRDPRLTELRLPKLSAEGIARGLSEMHVPDLSKLERPKIEMPDIDRSLHDVRRSIGKAVMSAAVAVGLVRPPRPRWPFVLAAAIIAGLTAWALMHSTAVRDRLARAARMGRIRVDEMREAHEEFEPVAFTAAATARIEPGPYAENGSSDVAGAFDAAEAVPNDYPENLGATTDQMDAALDGTPIFERADARN